MSDESDDRFLPDETIRNIERGENIIGELTGQRLAEDKIQLVVPDGVLRFLHALAAEEAERIGSPIRDGAIELRAILAHVGKVTGAIP